MSNKNQGRHENGGNYGGVRAEQGQGLQERASQIGDRVREGYESAQEGVAQGYRRAGEMVSDHPGSSVLLGFGLGFGLGVALTLLFRRERESWYDQVSDGLRNVPDRLRNMHLPEALARHMPGR